MTDADALLAANAAYYRAFAGGDFAAMSRIWADDGVTCIHPGWPALVGREPIFESYRGILHSGNRVRISHRDEVAIVSGSEARVLCVDGVWRMVHHQASPIATPQERETPPRGQRLN